MRPVAHASKLSRFLGVVARVDRLQPAYAQKQRGALPASAHVQAIGSGVRDDVRAGVRSGEPGEGDESVAALLLRLRDPRTGRPLPRARLWSELSVRMTAPCGCTRCALALWQCIFGVVRET